MPTASTPRFDTITLWLHWITVLLVLSQFGTAFSLGQVGPSQAGLVLAIHRSSGLLLWSLTAGRLVWRLTLMRLPPFAPEMPALQRLAVRTNEYGLYLLLLVQPLTGLTDSLFRAHAFPTFGMTIPVLVARSKPIYHAAHGLHLAGAVALACLVGLHAAAALFHRLVLRDGVLQTMLPGRPTTVRIRTSTPADG